MTQIFEKIKSGYKYRFNEEWLIVINEYMKIDIF